MPFEQDFQHDILDIDCETLKAWIEKGEALLIDVRETHEFEYENVPGAFLLPLSFLDVDIFPILKNYKIVFMCSIGKRSVAAIKQLRVIGLNNVFNLAGGMGAWKKAGFSTQGGKFDALDWSI